MSKKQIDPKWHAEQVRLFAHDEQPRYQAYAETLRTVLKAACARYAPLGIVETREKSVASFAEKAARKASKYQDPAHQLTDLCGGRVILGTPDEVEAFCGFIRASFVIDEANSLDTASRLGQAEFGYQSVHYVVQVRAPEILGVPVPRDVIGDRKAEIQVRTIAQHAWSGNTHDRLYKSTFNVPAALKRRAARIAALLEEVDNEFNRLEREYQEFLGNNVAFIDSKELQGEIEIQRLVLAVESKEEKKPALALRVAQLARMQKDYRAVVEVLQPWAETTGAVRLPIVFELGAALVELHGRAPGSRKLQQGIALLREAAGLPDASPPTNGLRPIRHELKLRAAAAGLLAAHAPRAEADALLTHAVTLDGDDPYLLCEQLGFNLARAGNRAAVDSARPAIVRALERCRVHVDARLQLPRAWFAMGRLNLLLRENAAALDGYAKAIRFYLSRADEKWTTADLETELGYLERVRGCDDACPGVIWARQLLRLGYWVKNGGKGAVATAVGRKVGLPRSRISAHGGRALIVAGATRRDLQSEMQRYAGCLAAALDGYSGLVLSGGTTVGIPDVVGRAFAGLRARDRVRGLLVGYHPYGLPHDVAKSPDYDHLIVSGKEEALGLGEPLQMWVDLLAAGVKPENVRLLGINGGNVSRFEYALALALGARVGLVQSSGRSADAVLSDPDWSREPNLLPLTFDAMTFQAFIQFDQHGLPDERLDRMGQCVHDLYREGTRPDLAIPGSLPWEVLPAIYKSANTDQAGFAVLLLRRAGYTVEAVGEGASLPVEPKLRVREGDIECLSEAEHGRWNCERLRSGWRYGPERDDGRRVHPNLVPWSKLTEKTKDNDRKAVRRFPEVLAAGGYIVTAVPSERSSGAKG